MFLRLWQFRRLHFMTYCAWLCLVIPDINPNRTKYESCYSIPTSFNFCVGIRYMYLQLSFSLILLHWCKMVEIKWTCFLVIGPNTRCMLSRKYILEKIYTPLRSKSVCIFRSCEWQFERRFSFLLPKTLAQNAAFQSSTSSTIDVCERHLFSIHGIMYMRSPFNLFRCYCHFK